MNKIILEDLDFILSSNNLDWEQFRGKTVLVTGAYGTLLSYITYTLMWLNEKKDMGITVIALVRSREKAEKRFAHFAESPYLKFFIDDLSSPVEITDHIDYIIHGAGYGDPQSFATNPVGVIVPNTIGTYHLLELARTKKIKGFLFFSSGSVYGTPLPDMGEEVTEEYFGWLDQLDTVNCYGESKRMAENMCRVWYQQYGIPAKIVRPTHNYGPTMDVEHDTRVIANFVRDILQGQHIVMKSDGSAKRTFCYIADAITAFFKVLLDGIPGEAYNVGNDYISIKELAEITVSVFPERKLQVIPGGKDDFRRLGKEIKMFVSSKKLLALGWKPSFPIREGMRRTVESFIERQNAK